MKLLELCKGTGSVGNVFAEHGWEVVSVDLRDDFKPTFCCDLHDWDYKQYPRVGLIVYGHHHLARITHKQGQDAKHQET